MSRRNKIILGGLISVIVIGVLAIVLATSGGGFRVSIAASTNQVTMTLDRTLTTRPIEDIRITVSGSTGIIGTGVTADSLTPSVVRVVSVTGTGANRTVRIEAVRNGNGYIRVASEGGRAETIIRVRVDIPAHSMAVRDGVHFGINRGNNELTFNESDFLFFDTIDVGSDSYETTIRNLTFSTNAAGAHFVGNRLVVNPDVTVGQILVTGHLENVTRPQGWSFQFPVHVFEPFSNVRLVDQRFPSINVIDNAVASMVRNNHDVAPNYINYILESVGGSVGINYGISVGVRDTDREMLTVDSVTGNNFRLVANIEGETTVDAFIYPITPCGIAFSDSRHRNVQRPVPIEVEIRNVFTDTLQFRRGADSATELFAFWSPGLPDRFDFQLSVDGNLNVNNTPNHGYNDHVTFGLSGATLPARAQTHPWEFVTITFASSATGTQFTMRPEHFTDGVPFGSYFTVALSYQSTPEMRELMLAANDLELVVRSVTRNIHNNSVATTPITLRAMHSITDINMPETLFPVVGAATGFEFTIDTNLDAATGIDLNHFEWSLPMAPPVVDAGIPLPLFNVVMLGRNVVTGTITARLDVNPAMAHLIIEGTTFDAHVTYINGFRRDFQIHTLAQLDRLNIRLSPVGGAGHIFYQHIPPRGGGEAVEWTRRAYIRIGGIYEVVLSPYPGHASVTSILTGADLGVQAGSFIFSPEIEGVFELVVNLTSPSPQVLGTIATEYRITIIVINPVMSVWLSAEQAQIFSSRTLSHVAGIPNNYTDSFTNVSVRTQLARPAGAQDRGVTSQVVPTWVGRVGSQLQSTLHDGDMTLSYLGNLEFSIQGHVGSNNPLPIHFNVTQVFTYMLPDNPTPQVFEIPLTIGAPLQFDVRITDAATVQQLHTLDNRDMYVFMTPTSVTGQVRVEPFPTPVWNPRLGFGFLVNGEIVQSTPYATINNSGLITALQSSFDEYGYPSELILIVFAYDSIRSFGAFPTRYITKDVFILDQRDPNAGQFLIETVDDWVNLMGYAPGVALNNVGGRNWTLHRRNPARDIIDGQFFLGADIDFAGRLFAPIPQFRGQLIGSHSATRHQIQNLTMIGNTTADFQGTTANVATGVIPGRSFAWIDGAEHYGLFGQIAEDALVRGIEFTNVEINLPSRFSAFGFTGRTAHLGVLAGVNYGTVQDVHVHVDSGWYIMAASENLNIGAIVGTNRGEISETTQMGASGIMRVTHASPDHELNMGGLVGANELGGEILGLHAGTILTGNVSINSEISLLLTAEIGTYQNVGGVVGLNAGLVQGVSSQQVIFNSTRGNNGGIVGLNDAGVVANVYSTSAIYARGILGGIVGTNRGVVQNAYYDLFVNTEIERLLATILFANLPQNVLTENGFSRDTPFYAGLMVGRDANTTIANAQDTIVGGVIGVNQLGRVENSFASSIFTNRSYFGQRHVGALPYRGDIFIHGARGAHGIGGAGHVIVGGVIGRQIGASQVTSVHSNLFINYENAGIAAAPIIGGVVGELAPFANLTLRAAYSHNYYSINRHATFADNVIIGGIIGIVRANSTNSSVNLAYSVFRQNEINGITIADANVNAGVGQFASGANVNFANFISNMANFTGAANINAVTGWGTNAGDYFAFMPNRTIYPFPRLIDGQGNWLMIATPDQITLQLRTSAEYRNPAAMGRREIFGARMNNLGGFNYVIPASNQAQRAALFLTSGATTVIDSLAPVANRYFLDDLFETVVEPEIAAGRVAVTIEGSPNVARLGSEPVGGTRRYFVQVLAPGTFDIVVTSTRHEPDLMPPTGRVTFDVIHGITQQTVHRTASGPVAWTNISHNVHESLPNRTITARRGVSFSLTASVDGTGWETASYVMQLTGTAPMVRTFIPQFSAGDAIYIAESLQTVVTVEILFGAIELEINQAGAQIDGTSAAVFSGTIVTDVVPTGIELSQQLASLVEMSLTIPSSPRPLRPLFEQGEQTTRVDAMHEGRNFNLIFTLEVEPRTPYEIWLHSIRDYAAIGHYQYNFHIYVAVEVNPEAFQNVGGTWPNAIPVGLISHLNVVERGRVDALRDSAELRIEPQQLHRVVNHHFSETQRRFMGIDPVTGARLYSNSEFELAAGQSPSSNLHTDDQRRGTGGLLTMNVIPMFSTLDAIQIESTEIELNMAPVDEEPVMASWDVALVQMVLNSAGNFEHYTGAVSGQLHQVSSVYEVADATVAGGVRRVYGWDGRIYVRTFIRAIGNHGFQIPRGLPFTVTATFHSLGRVVTQDINLVSIDRPGLFFHFDDPHTPTDRGVQAVGTTHVFSVHTVGNINVNWGNPLNVAQSSSDIQFVANYNAAQVAPIELVHRHDLGHNFYELRLDSTVNINRRIEIVFDFQLFVGAGLIDSRSHLEVTTVLFRVVSFNVQGVSGNTIRLVNNTRQSMELGLVTQRYRGTDGALLNQIDTAIRTLEGQIAQSDYLTWHGRNRAQESFRLNIGGTADEYFNNSVGPFGQQRGALNFFLGRGDTSGVKFITAGIPHADANFLDIEMFFTISGGTYVIMPHHTGLSVRTTFNVATVLQSDEANPIPITNERELATVGTNAAIGQHFILMEDITITSSNWNVGAGRPGVEFRAATLDGNNRRIHIQSLHLPNVQMTTGNNPQPVNNQQVNIGLFSIIHENSVIKNLNIVLPQGAGAAGQGSLLVDTSQYGDGSTINVGALAGRNDGIVTNVAVLTNGMFVRDAHGFYIADYTSSDFDTQNSRARSMLDVRVDNQTGVIRVGGLVGLNMGLSQINQAVITNSRVLVDVQLRHSTDANRYHIQHANVGGFVGENRGVVVASFFRDGNVINTAQLRAGGNIRTAGFVGWNNTVGAAGTIAPAAGGVRGVIRSSYAMGDVRAGGAETDAAGFVHQNNGEISDIYTNVRVTHGRFRAGFVNHSVGSGTITNVFANNPTPIVGTPYHSFANTTFHPTQVGLSNNRVANFTGAQAGGAMWQLITAAQATNIATFEGFSVSQSWEVRRPNIWHMEEYGPRLVSPDHIAVSIRIQEGFELTTGRPQINHHEAYDFGGANNPMIVWSGEQFNRLIHQNSRAADQPPLGPGNVPLFVDWDDNVFGGNIRLVNNINLASVDVQTFQIIFRGQLDGNGLEIRGISVGNAAITETTRPDGGLRSVGLFSRLEYATVKNIDLSFVTAAGGYSVWATNATFAGGLAGIAVNSNVVDVNVRHQEANPIRGVVAQNIVGGVIGAVVNFNYDGNEVLVDGTLAISEGNMGEVFKIENVQSNLVLQSIIRNGAPMNINFNGADRYMAHDFTQIGVAGGVIGVIATDVRTGRNSGNNEAAMFMRDVNGNVIPQDRISAITDHVHVRNIGNYGEARLEIRAEVVGGIIGVVEEDIHVQDARFVTAATNSLLEGKFYVGGVIGVNMGRVERPIIDTPTLHITGNPVAGTPRFIFEHVNGQQLFGMTVGGIAGFNSGEIIDGRMHAHLNHANMSQVMTVGGAVGENMGGVISGTRVYGAVVGGFHLGGLIGINHGGAFVNSGNYVSDVTFRGAITGTHADGISVAVAGGSTTQINAIFPRPQVRTENGITFTWDPFNIASRVSNPNVPLKSYFTNRYVGFNA